MAASTPTAAAAEFALAFNKKTAQSHNRFASVDLGGRGLLELSDAEFASEVADKVYRHGVICVKRQQLTPAQMKRVSQRFGEPVLLPAAFSFENRDPATPEVVRVGNIRLDGTIKSGSTEAQYMHVDGQFNGSPRNQIVNCLHAKTIPPVGGNTGFIDTTLAYRELFDAATKAKIKTSTMLASCRWISDFKGAKAEDMLPDVALPCAPTHPVTGEELMYLFFTPDGLFDEAAKEHWVGSEELWKQMIDNGYTYEHTYEEGDVLMWDNLQVMHASLGGFGDHPRLLYRAQARYAQPGAMGVQSIASKL